MNSDATQRSLLRELLQTVRRRALALQATAGMVSFVALGAWVYLAVIVWTAASNEPELWKATLVSRGAVVVLLALFGYLVVWPLLRIPRVDALADEVERRKDLRELLRAGFEFSNDTKAKKRYSAALVDESGLTMPVSNNRSGVTVRVIQKHVVIRRYWLAVHQIEQRSHSVVVPRVVMIADRPCVPVVRYKHGVH